MLTAYQPSWSEINRNGFHETSISSFAGEDSYRAIKSRAPDGVALLDRRAFLRTVHSYFQRDDMRGKLKFFKIAATPNYAEHNIFHCDLLFHSSLLKREEIKKICEFAAHHSQYCYPEDKALISCSH